MFITENLDEFISIGELANLTGITTHTLRVWEKRYGAPKSKRLPSGHRRYPKDDIPRLKAIAKALESGYRPSRVVRGSLEELQSLVGSKVFIDTNSSLDSVADERGQYREMLVEGLIKAVHDYDDDYIFDKFHEEWGRDGTLSFLTNIAGPFLERIGQGWVSNELSISNEHFASECLASFLNEKWRRMNGRKHGIEVLIASLPGEPYTLGLLMCAVATAVTNSKIIYLGNNNPIEDIINSSNNNMPKLIALSISHFMPKASAESMLLKIRNNVSEKTLMVTGGKGSPCAIPGVSFISDFGKYYNLLIKLNREI